MAQKWLRAGVFKNAEGQVQEFTFGFERFKGARRGYRIAFRDSQGRRFGNRNVGLGKADLVTWDHNLLDKWRQFLDANGTWLNNQAIRGRKFRLARLFAEWQAQDGINHPVNERRAHEFGPAANVIHSFAWHEEEDEDDVREYRGVYPQNVSGYSEDYKTPKLKVDEETKSGLKIIYVDAADDMKYFLEDDEFAFKTEARAQDMKIEESDSGIEIIRVTRGPKKIIMDLTEEYQPWGLGDLVDLTGDEIIDLTDDVVGPRISVVDLTGEIDDIVKKEKPFLMSPTASGKPKTTSHRVSKLIKYRNGDRSPSRRGSRSSSKCKDSTHRRSGYSKHKRPFRPRSGSPDQNPPRTPHPRYRPSEELINPVTPPRSTKRRANHSRPSSSDPETFEAFLKRLSSRD